MKKILLIVGEIIKWAAVAVALVFIVTRLSTGRESASSMEKVSAAVLDAANLSPMKAGDNQMIRRLYGLDPEAYDGIVLYYPETNMGAEELLLVKLKDVSQMDTVVRAIEERRAAQMKSFDGYGVDQYDMLEHSVLEPAGNFVLFVSAKETAGTLSAFKAAL